MKELSNNTLLMQPFQKKTVLTFYECGTMQYDSHGLGKRWADPMGYLFGTFFVEIKNVDVMLLAVRRIVDVLGILFVSFIIVSGLSSKDPNSNQIDPGICANATENVCGDSCKKLLIMFKEMYSHGWAVRHKSLGQTFLKLKCNYIIEIGTARGELAHYLLKHIDDIKEYHAVDPFLGGYDKYDAMSNELSFANSSYEWSQAILHIFKHFNCKFQLHYGKSNTKINDFQDEIADCIFIDGDHTYKSAKEDIHLYSSKLKKGGALIFDDYSSSYMGVVNAVDELVDINRLKFHKINEKNSSR